MSLSYRQNVCDDKHGCVVVYTGHHCPVCDLEKELEASKKWVEHLTDRLASEKDYVVELIEDLKKLSYEPAAHRNAEGRIFQDDLTT